MNVLAIIENYYKKDSDLYNLLIKHSTDVMNKSVEIAQNHPELGVNTEFLKEAAMLHDIGVFLTDAEDIHCYGIAPYICHGYLGAEILIEMGYPIHGLVCERHTGTGLTMEDIINQKLPLPVRDMVPVTIEEQLICYADCFFSKTKLDKEKTIDEVRLSLAKHGKEKLRKFEEWTKIFA